MWELYSDRPRGGAGGTSRTTDAGSVLVPVMLFMMLFSAIAASTALLIRVEVLVQERFQAGAEALYGAEAGLAAALAELRDLSSWTPVLDGSRSSSRSDGSLFARRAEAGAEFHVCCGAGSAAERLARETALSAAPGRRAVRWRAFLWTPVAALFGPPQTPLFVIVWAGDDEADGDGNATADANGIVILRAEAIGPRGLRRVIEAYVSRRGPDEEDEAGGEDERGVLRAVALLTWREVR